MPNITGTDRNGNPVEFVDGSWRPVISKGMTAARNIIGGLGSNLANIPLNYVSSFVNGASRFNPNFNGENVLPFTENGPLGDMVASMGPSEDQVLAGVQVGAERAAQLATGSDVPVTPFRQAEQQQAETSRIAQEQNPMTFLASQLGTDVATLLAIRAPGSRSRAIWDMNQAHAVRLLDSARKAPVTGLAPAAKNLKDFLGSSLSSSPLFATMQRGATKAAESGLDGMILGVMNRQDPYETLALGAGAQAGSSLLMSTLTGFSGTGSWGTRLALEAASIMAIMQVGRSLMPGEDGSPISDFGAAFDKIVPAAVLGMFGAMAGGGRLTGTKSFQELRNMAPALIESAQTAVRGLSLETINGLFADDRSQKVLERLARDPGAFGPTVGRRVERAISTNQNLRDVLDQLESTSREFRERLSEL